MPIRDMRVIKGKLDSLLDKEVVSLGNKDDYISAVITDEDYVMDAIGKIRCVYKNILKLEYDNKRNIVNKVSELEKVDLNKLSEIELFINFYYEQNNIDLSDDKLMIVKDVINEVKD